MAQVGKQDAEGNEACFRCLSMFRLLGMYDVEPFSEGSRFCDFQVILSYLIELCSKFLSFMVHSVVIL